MTRWAASLAVLFLAALGVRVIYLLEISRKSPFWDYPYLDARYYLDWATRILHGDIIGSEVFVRAPGYPYFLAFLGIFFGLSYWAVELANAVIGAATCVLIAAIGRKAMNPKIGLIAGVVAAVHGALIYWGGEVLIETLFDLLILIWLLLCLRARSEETVGSWIWAGLLGGLAAITRPTGLAVIPVLALAALWRLPRGDSTVPIPAEPDPSRTAPSAPAIQPTRPGTPSAGTSPSAPAKAPAAPRPRPSSRPRLPRWKAAVAGLGAAGVVLGLLSLRNFAVGGDFVPIASHGGINFWTGNNEKADGKIVVVPEGIEITPEWQGKDNMIAVSVIGAEKALGRHLKPSEVSAYWVGKGLTWMARHPLDAIKLYIKKVYYFWEGCEITNNEDFYSFRRYSWLLSALMLPLGPIYLPGALIMPLALLGIAMDREAFRRRLPLVAFVALYMVTVVAFFVSSRHRLPVVPVAILFATSAAVSLAVRIREQGFRRTWRPVAILALLFLVFSVNVAARPAGTLTKFREFEFLVHVQRGTDFVSASRRDLAEVEFREALALRPTDAEANYRLGLICLSDGRFPEAQSHLEVVAQATPKDPIVHTNLALTYYYEGRLADARRELKAAQDCGGTVDPQVRAMIGS